MAPLHGLVLSPSERRDHIGSASLPFMERWVVKEAVLKALGLGIAEHLQALSVMPAPGPSGTYHLEHSIPVSSSLQAWSLAAPSGYAAALSYFDADCTCYAYVDQGQRYSTTF
ncbi:MAG TPA: hypothetical protein DD676_10030 [Halomonas sp.]|nr:hypothetical protein [Halomonas sp.]